MAQDTSRLPPAWMLGFGATVPTPAPVPVPAPVTPQPVIYQPQPVIQPIPVISPLPVVGPIPIPNNPVAPPPIVPVVNPIPVIVKPPTQVSPPPPPTPPQPIPPPGEMPWYQYLALYIASWVAEAGTGAARDLQLDPSLLLWQGNFESGGRFDAMKREGYWTAMKRDYYSYGVFQINEKWAQALYNDRALLGATNSTNTPTPPSDPAPVGAWRGPLTAKPGSLLYGLINYDHFIRYCHVFFAVSGTTDFAPKSATSIPSYVDHQDVLASHDLSTRVHNIATNLVIPPLAILCREYWAAGSMQGMLAAIKGNYGEAWLKQGVNSWSASVTQASKIAGTRIGGVSSPSPGGATVTM